MVIDEVLTQSAFGPLRMEIIPGDQVQIHGDEVLVLGGNPYSLYAEFEFQAPGQYAFRESAKPLLFVPSRQRGVAPWPAPAAFIAVAKEDVARVFAEWLESHGDEIRIAEVEAWRQEIHSLTNPPQGLSGLQSNEEINARVNACRDLIAQSMAEGLPEPGRG